MNNQTGNQTIETTDANLLRMHLRFIRQDLFELSNRIYDVKEKLKDEEMRLQLDNAEDEIKWVHDALDASEDEGNLSKVIKT